MANVKELAEMLTGMAGSLGEYGNIKQSSMKDDNRLRFAYRYLVLACIQLSLDIACSVISRKNLGMPNSYNECIRILFENAYIDNEQKEFYASAINVRDILLHDFSGLYEKDILFIGKNCHYFVKFSESITAFEL